MIQTPENNLRRESLESLKILKDKKSAPVYAGLIKNNVRGRELDILKNRLLSGKVTNHATEYAFQTELLELMSADFEKARQNVEQEEAFIARKTEERQQAYEEFLKAKEKLEIADKTLEAAKVVMNNFQKEKAGLANSIESVKQRKNNINTIILVHRSAGLGQLMEYPLGEVIVTEADFNFLSGILIPDKVFDKDLGEGLIQNLPYQFGTDIEESYLESVVQFVEMAMYYYLIEEKQVIMLYADNNIATVLKKEGAE